jgi:hypothetical protein
MSERAGEFILFSLGLGRTNKARSDRSWFIVDGREIECSMFQSLFISLTVERIMRSDSTTIVNRFEMDSHLYENALIRSQTFVSARDGFLNSKYSIRHVSGRSTSNSLLK